MLAVGCRFTDEDCETNRTSNICQDSTQADKAHNWVMLASMMVNQKTFHGSYGLCESQKGCKHPKKTKVERPIFMCEMLFGITKPICKWRFLVFWETTRCWRPTVILRDRAWWDHLRSRFGSGSSGYPHRRTTRCIKVQSSSLKTRLDAHATFQSTRKFGIFNIPRWPLDFGPSTFETLRDKFTRLPVQETLGQGGKLQGFTYVI